MIGILGNKWKGKLLEINSAFQATHTKKGSCFPLAVQRNKCSEEATTKEWNRHNFWIPRRATPFLLAGRTTCATVAVTRTFIDLSLQERHQSIGAFCRKRTNNCKAVFTKCFMKIITLCSCAPIQKGTVSHFNHPLFFSSWPETTLTNLQSIVGVLAHLSWRI